MGFPSSIAKLSQHPLKRLQLYPRSFDDGEGLYG